MAEKLTRLTHKIAIRGRELYHLQFSLQVASPETFGYCAMKRELSRYGNGSLWFIIVTNK